MSTNGNPVKIDMDGYGPFRQSGVRGATEQKVGFRRLSGLCVALLAAIVGFQPNDCLRHVRC